MAIPTWAAGQVLTASDVNTWFVPLAAVKTVDEALTSNTTLQNDDALTLAVAANVSYDFQCLVIYTALSGGDIKWIWTIPASATLLYQCVHNEGGGTGLSNSHLVSNNSGNGFGVGSGTTTNVGLWMSGTLATASTSGSLTLTWAQNSSSGSATTVRTGSKLLLRRVA